MMTCWMCNTDYEEDPERVRAWAESDKNFDPTDWECPDCKAASFRVTEENQRKAEAAYDDWCNSFDTPA